MKIVILAGGSGTRLWPLSRQNNPKQAQPFLDNDTLLQKTYARLRKGFAASDIYVATMAEYAGMVRGQLPELAAANLLSEPCRRDTAAAIGLAATMFYFRNPREIMLTVQADHYIDDEDSYLATLSSAGRLIKNYPDYGGLVGVQPTTPETGYGYIKINNHFTSFEERKIFHIERFVEKPDAATARVYISHWGYLWNPGYFIWRVDTLLAQYRKFLPAMYRGLAAINRTLGTKAQAEAVAREFAAMTPVAVEYGILEKADNLIVMPADFTFTDIGSWRTVKNILAANQRDNIIKGGVVALDSANNLIYNFTRRALGVAGLRDTIVVMTEDATLIANQDSAQEVKKIVAELERQGKQEYL